MRPREPGFVRDAVASLLLRQGEAGVSEIYAGLLEEHGPISASSMRCALSLNVRLFKRVSHGRYRLRHFPLHVRQSNDQSAASGC